MGFKVNPFLPHHIEVPLIDLHICRTDPDGATLLGQESIVEGDGGVLHARNLAGVLFELPGSLGGQSGFYISEEFFHAHDLTLPDTRDYRVKTDSNDTM